MNFEKLFSTIDTHVVGEAFRIVIQSPITFLGSDIKSNHDKLKNNFENEKNLLLNEPRGHRGMHGCVVTSSSVADFGLLFFNHEAVTNFKYEGLLATVTALIETGNLNRKKEEIYTVETENGIYTVKANVNKQEVASVYIESEASSDINFTSDYVSIRVDNARNYLLFTLPESIPNIELVHLAALNNWGMACVAKLAKENVDFEGVIVVESGQTSPNKVRSVTFEKDGYILRSPGIDSTIAILSSLLDRFASFSEIENESIFGSSLKAKVLSASDRRFSIETEAFVTGLHEFILDEDDPLRNGFLLV
ncbi:proline racemase family protein [Psychrobacillus sp. OK032]|uniref:proline racemase family protein n=1 Tax=Psychrobacillus sp. OK032 TaxID=1884358 RepID=UPI0008B0B74A|nr:proline racemase family protein [Psychrobacillus sp. OK032]SES19201.1 Proline racemase [Psychrobacillus sp. OK032]